MLEKDRQQRIPSVRLVGAELEAMLKGRKPSGQTAPAKHANRFSAPTPAAHALRHDLPSQTTPFFGRQTELAELARLWPTRMCAW